MIFADSNLQSFYALYSNCCQFAMTPSMLREHESKLSVTQQGVFVCLLYMGVLQPDPIPPKLCFAVVLTICMDFFADCKDFLS